MKWRVSGVLFALVYCLCVSGAMAFDKSSKAISFAPETNIVHSCWDPSAQYATTLDTLVELKRGQFKKHSSGAVRGSPFALLFDGHTRRSFELGFGVMAAVPDVVSSRCPTPPVFALLRAVVFASLMTLMSAVMVAMSKSFCDVASDRAQAAIFGYVLSVNLGFVIFGLNGVWSQDSLFAGLSQTSDAILGISPTIVMLMLVGCAWYRFLRQSALSSNQQMM